jgi:hypothetical protein
MYLAGAVECWIFAMLGWCWYALQRPIFPSTLMEAYVYMFLVTSTLNVFFSTVSQVDKNVPRAFFGFTMGNFIYTLYQASESVAVGQQTTGSSCCANSNYTDFNRAVNFMKDPVVSAIPAGIWLGFSIISILMAGMSASATGGRLWSNRDLGTTLGFILSLRMTVILDEIILPLCPNDMAYFALFGLPLFRFPVMYFLIVLGYITLMTVNVFLTRKLAIVMLGVAKLAISSCLIFMTIIGTYYRSLLTVQLFILLFLILLLELADIVGSVLGLSRVEKKQVGCNMLAKENANATPKKNV